LRISNPFEPSATKLHVVLFTSVKKIPSAYPFELVYLPTNDILEDCWLEVEVEVFLHDCKNKGKVKNIKTKTYLIILIRLYK
jgi:hypothetical protein